MFWKQTRNFFRRTVRRKICSGYVFECLLWAAKQNEALFIADKRWVRAVTVLCSAKLLYYYFWPFIVVKRLERMEGITTASPACWEILWISGKVYTEKMCTDCRTWTKKASEPYCNCVCRAFSCDADKEATSQILGCGGLSEVDLLLSSIYCFYYEAALDSGKVQCNFWILRLLWTVMHFSFVRRI